LLPKLGPLPQISHVDATAVLLLFLHSYVDEPGHLTDPAGQKGIKTRGKSANRHKNALT